MLFTSNALETLPALRQVYPVPSRFVASKIARRFHQTPPDPSPAIATPALPAAASPTANSTVNSKVNAPASSTTSATAGLAERSHYPKFQGGAKKPISFNSRLLACRILRCLQGVEVALPSGETAEKLRDQSVVNFRIHQTKTRHPKTHQTKTHRSKASQAEIRQMQALSPVSPALAKPLQQVPAATDLRTHDHSALDSLFASPTIQDAMADIDRVLHSLWPAPCWEDDPFDFLREFL